MRDAKHIARACVAVLAIFVMTVPAVGCSSGGDEGSQPGTTAVTTGGNTGTTLPGGTGSGVIIDPLSSFKSKDPFILQAQVTTTTIPAVPITTVTTLPTTSSTVITTHRLTVTAIGSGATTVSFSIDNDDFTNFEAGPAVFSSQSWGSIQIVSIQATSATFKRNGYINLTVPLGESRTWK